jgi:hypothetical protein
MAVLTGLAGGLLDAIGAFGWPLAALGGGLGACLVAAACWVLSSTPRTRRAAILLRAARRSDPHPPQSSARSPS